MDLPVFVALISLMWILFIFAAVILVKGSGKASVYLGALVLIGVASFIAYGLDTQCVNIAIYRKC